MIVSRLPRGARVVIYGAGGRGRLLETVLQERRPDVEVLGYSDTFKRGSYGSLPIFAPDRLPEQFDLLVIASAQADRIVSDLPEALLPRVVAYDPSAPRIAVGGAKHPALATTRMSQAMLMNFFNLPMLGPDTAFTAVHLDPEWTLSLWNPYLRGKAAEGRIVHHDAVAPGSFDGVYLFDYGNEHVLRFLDATALAGTPLCHAGLRARLRNTVLELKGRFPRLSVVEFGSICSVAGGNFSTLGIAEMLGPDDRFVTVNLDAGSIRSARSVCREYPFVEYVCGTSGEFVEERLDAAGTIHFACLLHLPCSEPCVAREFAAMEAHIPEGGRVLIAHNDRHAVHPDLERAVAGAGFGTVSRDNAGWMLERA